jgi:predicted ArsR family transcriptional regulator
MTTAVGSPTLRETVTARILAALDQRPDGMRREELERVTGVRTQVARATLYGLVARGAVVAPESYRTGRGRAKRYFRGQESQGTTVLAMERGGA